jgi:release factor glutamine methyltransferase
MLESGFPAVEDAPRPVTLGVEIRRLTGLFRVAGIASAALDARLLAAEACGLAAEDAILRRDMALDSSEVARIAAFAARRLAGEPVSRIMGRREFWGLSFDISPATLDPRPESELLVQTVLDYVKSEGLRSEPMRILDLGTGTGCLLCALLSELPLSQGVGLDRSEDALAVAQDNLSRLGLRERASLLCGNWLSSIGGAPFDVIVCNPPYIETGGIGGLDLAVRGYDPVLALDGGEDGLKAYRHILPQAQAVLRPGGLLIFEVGYTQGRAALDLMQQTAPDAGFTNVGILTDLAGAERAVAGVRQSERETPNCKKRIGNSALSRYGRSDRRFAVDP